MATVLPSLEVLLVQSSVGCLVSILDFFDYSIYQNYKINFTMSEQLCHQKLASF